ncbi:MAG: SusC/RagA family TonB-linked outer membrane protein [Dysgonomonas sp.]|nr:SusC/RagA family TonB-linked outer membrane protein [Dysgonomonas sp.]
MNKKGLLQQKRPFKFKRYLIILCLVLLGIPATSAYAQKGSITLTMQDTKLKQVLDAVEKQTDYFFVYDMKINVDQTVSVKAEKMPLQTFLNQLLGNIGINYTIENKTIALIVAEKTENKPKTISGKILDSDGEPIVGASVAIKGTTTGVMTDVDGKFSISAAKGNILVFAYLGHVTREIVVGDAVTLQPVILKEDNVALDEVVITALGIKRSQKALSYNVQEIGSETVTTVKDANFISSLSGKVAGVDIKTTAGGVGAMNRVTMRGSRSILRNNNVLYVIDGIPTFNQSSGGDLNDQFSSESGTESIADISPDDIESMSVLNGPAAAALYGSNAANGAILITTKKGAVGKPKLSYSNQTTFSKPFILPKFQNTYGNKAQNYDSWGDKLATPSTYDPADYFNTGTTTQHSLSLTVGNERNQTYASISALASDGIITQSKYDRYNFTFRNTTNFLNDKMSLDFGFNFIRQDDRNMVAQGMYFNPLTSVYTFPRGEDFSPIRSYEYFHEGRNIMTQFWPYGDQGLDMQNPYWIANRNVFTHDKKRYMANVGLKYQVFDWLNLAGRIRMDNSYTEHERKMYATTPALHAGGPSTEESKGYYSYYKINGEQTYADIMANINKSFDDFSLTATLGGSFENFKYDRLGSSGTLKSVPNGFYINNIRFSEDPTSSNDYYKEQTQSIFASTELGWRSMVYLTLTARNDWSSTLANMPDKSFFYPSVGLSGIISEMVSLPKFISYLKVRGSYADVGNSIPRQITSTDYVWDNGTKSYKKPSYMQLEELFPESTRSWEVGLDARFFKNTLKMDLSLYKSNTYDQTLLVPVSSTTGYSNKYIQTGNVLNKGLEFRLSYSPNLGKFKWESTFTASINKNKIIDLGKYQDETGKIVYLEDMGQGGIGSTEIRLTKGGSLGDIWATRDLMYDDNGNIYVDVDGNLSTMATKEKVGSTMPKWKFGLHNSFGWNNITAGFLISARTGGQVISATQAILDSYGVSKSSAQLRDRGGKQINNGRIDAEVWYKTVGGTQGVYKYYVYDADNIRLSEVSLGYTLPTSWFKGLMRAHVSFVGRNLWMIYNKAPFDPENSPSTDNYYQGIDFFMQPSQRNLGFSVKLDF